MAYPDVMYYAQAQGTEIRLRKIAKGRLSPVRRKSDSETPKRGKVSEFSAKSRVRLMSIMNRIDFSRRADCVFVTLTYGASWPSPTEAKRHLRAFLKRIKRLRSNASALWRIEFQKRGAPHFHVLVYGVRFIKKEWVKLAWSRVLSGQFHASDGREPFTRIEKIRTATGAMFYLSKYVAKHSDGFNYVPYLAKADSAYLDNGSDVGRHWGVEWRDCLPFGKAFVVELTSEVWRRLRAAMVDLMPKFVDEWPNNGLRMWMGSGAADWVMACAYHARDRLICSDVW